MSMNENSQPASFHFDRIDAIVLELWKADNIDLHMCDGSMKKGQREILNDLRVSWRNLTPMLRAALSTENTKPQGEGETDPAPVSHTRGLTLASLQSSHVERQEEWCPDQKPDLSFRGNELGGECGEAQNVIKKLERERHGWRGSRDTVEHLAEELADVIHCAILVAITAGIEIEPAVIAKFNDTSEKNGLRTLLATTEGQP